MVRLMAASLRRIGEGEEGEEAIRLRLEGERLSPLSPAPPDGLILWDVDCGISFLPFPVEGRRRTFLVRLGEHHTALERVVRDLGEEGPPPDPQFSLHLHTFHQQMIE